MAREKFRLIASLLPSGCFGRFDEAANRAALSAGTADPEDPYSWIEAAFEVRLIREGEATRCCSLTPSSYYVTMRHVFVGEPNAAWERDGDPDGLERAVSADDHGYMALQRKPSALFRVNSFVIDTVKELDMRKPRAGSARMDEYHQKLWEAAEQAAFDLDANGGLECAPIFSTYTYRNWERARVEGRRRRLCEESKRARMSWPRDLLAPYEEARSRAEHPEFWRD